MHEGGLMPQNEHMATYEQGTPLDNTLAPHIDIGKLFMFNTDLLWYIISMGIFRPWVEKHFISKIPYEIEKNLSRLACQWTEEINTAIRGIQTEAERSVRDQIATVESLLSRSPSETEEIRSSLAEIELQSLQLCS
jgi:hypothetical protein